MKSKFLIGMLCIVMLALAACGPSGGPTSEPADTPSASSSQGSTGAPSSVSLDPALATEATAWEAIGHLYEGLVTTQDGAPTAALAFEVVPSADQLDYIFSLRPGVTFHDGTPLNADAVLTNFNRWFDPSHPLHGSGDYAAWVESFGGFKGETDADGNAKSNFDGIEKINDLSVIVHLNEPDPDFLTKLTNPAFAIVSPAALAASGFGTPSGTDGGTGAYQIATWDGASLTLSPFGGYWNQTAIPTDNMEMDLGG